MRASSIFLIAAAVLLVIMALMPQESDAGIPRRKLQKLKKLAGIAFLLKGKKKILFPLPLPLPLPIPHHAPVHFPVAEPWAFAEPHAEPLAHGHGHGFGHLDLGLAHGGHAFGGHGFGLGGHGLGLGLGAHGAHGAHGLW